MTEPALTPPITHSLVTALRAVPSFASLDDRTLLKVVGASSNLFWRDGGCVFEKGSDAEALYIVLSGGVRIVDVRDEGDVEVARVGPGDFFGELSLLLNAVHSKHAEAVADSELMVIPKEPFRELLAESPALAAECRRRFEERLPGQAELASIP